jgi:hypothetical protein
MATVLAVLAGLGQDTERDPASVEQLADPGRGLESLPRNIDLVHSAPSSSVPAWHCAPQSPASATAGAGSVDNAPRYPQGAGCGLDTGNTEAAGLSSASASSRIRAARAAAALCVEADPALAAGLLDRAVRLLPEVTARRLERGDQQYAISEFAGLASDAAAMALAEPSGVSGEREASALGLLEAGRAVLLSQALDTRSDMTDLRQKHPGLATILATLREQLDQPSDAVRQLIHPGDAAEIPLGQAAERRRDLARQLAEALAEIRALDGFASFGLPPTTAELLSQAAPGPVVTSNVTDHRSDALILTERGVACLELPGLSRDMVAGQLRSFHQALIVTASPSASSADRRDAQSSVRQILEWLWDVAAGPVLDELGYRHEPSSEETWPRVWWAPGGMLSLLPIHAAGYHNDSATASAKRSVIDRVVSSYTPTIRALRYARQHVLDDATIVKSLIVAMPVTPLLPGAGLPNVLQEVSGIQNLLPQPIVLIEPTNDSDPMAYSAGLPTRARVLEYLPDCSIVHFTCHGASHPSDPSKSLLYLHDHDSDPFTVASLGPVNLGQAQLAYLSACRTASSSNTELIDEAIHLTTAFQLAGFAHVIGTFWEISDRHAAEVAVAFYDCLRDASGTLDTNRAARALHQCVRTQRDKYRDKPSLWAAYLHAGC